MTAACWISAIHYAPPVRWNRFAFTFCTSYWKKPTPNASRSVQVFLTPLQNTSANHCMPFSSPRNSSRSAYAPPFNRIVSLHTMQNWFVAPLRTYGSCGWLSFAHAHIHVPPCIPHYNSSTSYNSRDWPPDGSKPHRCQEVDFVAGLYPPNYHATVHVTN